MVLKPLPLSTCTRSSSQRPGPVLLLTTYLWTLLEQSLAFADAKYPFLQDWGWYVSVDYDVLLTVSNRVRGWFRLACQTGGTRRQSGVHSVQILLPGETQNDLQVIEGYGRRSRCFQFLFWIQKQSFTRMSSLVYGCRLEPMWSCTYHGVCSDTAVLPFWLTRPAELTALSRVLVLIIMIL